GKTLIVKSMDELLFIDLATKDVKQRLRLPPYPILARSDEKPDVPLLGGFELYFGKVPLKPGFGVVGLHVKGDHVFASDAHNQLRHAKRREGGNYLWDKAINMLLPPIGCFANGAGTAPLSADW